MASALEAKGAVRELVAEAEWVAWSVVVGSSGSFVSRRRDMLEQIPLVIDYFAEATGAVAADQFDEERVLQGASGRFTASVVVSDRAVQIGNAVAWVAAPLADGSLDSVRSRLAEVIPIETARGFRDTTLANRRRDPACAGWMRVASGSACAFCRALASRGAVYKRETARFAAHPNCFCTARAVFAPGDFGPEASALQYLASGRRRTPEQRERVRDWVALFA